MNLERPDAAQRPVAVYGPELWHTVAGAEWSYWDLWFCVVCLIDHDGDWNALDTAIQSTDRYHGEAKWSHLQDLTERLDCAGLTAAVLAGQNVREPKLRAKARTKVMKSSLYPRDLTAAMRNPPSARLTRCAMFGSWPDFPQSPQAWYDRLSARFDVEAERYWDGWVTRTLAYEIAEAEDDLAGCVGTDAAQLLAVRRAALTLYYQAAEACDDSYGALGDVAGRGRALAVRSNRHRNRIQQLARARRHGRCRCEAPARRHRHQAARRRRRPWPASRTAPPAPRQTRRSRYLTQACSGQPAARGRYPAAVGRMSRVQLDALVEEATVDCYDEDEQVTGLYTMIEDNLAVPFHTTVLGVEVTVESIDLTDHGRIVANCRRRAFRQTIPVLDLPLPTPAPDGAQWIEAYRHWAR